MTKERILVVDDEPRYLRLVRFNLEAAGYAVECAATGEEALEALPGGDPNLVILDIMLPGIDGFEVCRRIRDFSTVPIIMLSARGAEEDKVEGLRLGADDYVAKPFSANELLARVEAVLRRTRRAGPPVEDSSYALGDLRVDLPSREVTVRGQGIQLSPTEYRLLVYLASNMGKTVTHDDILLGVWGTGYEGEHRVVRVTVWRLRRKIEDDPSDPRFITTAPGVGYLFGGSM